MKYLNPLVNKQKHVVRITDTLSFLNNLKLTFAAVVFDSAGDKKQQSSVSGTI